MGKAEDAQFAGGRYAIQNLQHALKPCATMMEAQPAVFFKEPSK